MKSVDIKTNCFLRTFKQNFAHISKIFISLAPEELIFAETFAGALMKYFFVII